MTPDPTPVRDGRSLAWRLKTLVVGALFVGAAWALVRAPELLAYAAAAVLAGVGLLCAVSALAARGR